MKKVLILAFLISVTKTMAQIPILPSYTDPGNKIALQAEKLAANILENVKKNTRNEWGKTSLATVAEKNGTTTLGKPIRYVHFIKYANMCDYYVNDKKEKLCDEKVAYLRNSHDIVFDLLHVEPLFEMRKGVKDLIWEKYASISNIIIKELEKIKREIEKEEKNKEYLKYKG